MSTSCSRDSSLAADTEAYGNYLAHCTRERVVDDSLGQSETVHSGAASRSSRDSRPSTRQASHELTTIDIRSTSPEPEDSLEKLSRVSDESSRSSREEAGDQYDYRITRLKNWRNLFMTLTTALSIALLGTLAGLIFLAVTRNNGGPSDTNELLPSSNNPIPTLHETVTRTTFDDISNNDPAIAKVFADHSLYQSFYGVNYDGVDVKNCSAPGLQRLIAVDAALLSRVTERVRIEHDECNLTERVLKAILDMKVSLAVTLNIKASEWTARNSEIRRILASYPSILFDSVILEQDSVPNVWYRAYSELQAFLKQQSIDSIQIKLTEPMSEQPNPLDLTNDPNVTRSWITSDKARRTYTRLESPAETSEKARAMTAWVCEVAKYLDSDIAWFWTAGFDSDSGRMNGIFASDRTLKPAGLPRCGDH